MRKTILVYFIPLLIAITCLFIFNIKINNIFFQKELNIPIDSSYRYIGNFEGNWFYEDSFLLSKNNSPTIYILGSSELTLNIEAIPYNFITDHFKIKLIGAGHAGNQCFSIYSQLLANENRLKNAPIVIVLSPGWFYSWSAQGTAPSSFLEFNSPRFLNSILQNDSIPLFKEYEIKRIMDFYKDIAGQDLSMRLFYLKNQCSKSFFDKCFYSPIVAIDNVLNTLKFELLNISNYKTTNAYINRKSIIPESVKINWDSLFIISKQEQFKKADNNNWYIDNEYFNKNIKGKTNTVVPVDEKNNQELKDFKMLVKLLKTKKVNASFIIIPLNPYYYINSKELTPLINSLQTEINNNNFPCLNFWNPDSTTFDNGILKDIMHLSSYGWYKADKFIVETYKLAK